MYKITIFLMFISGVVNAGTYQCGTFKLTTVDGKIQLAGFLGNGSKSVVGVQTKYNPTAKYAGSIRFDISSVCNASGTVYVILDKNLSEGNSGGELTTQSTCDGDGELQLFNGILVEFNRDSNPLGQNLILALVGFRTDLIGGLLIKAILVGCDHTASVDVLG